MPSLWQQLRSPGGFLKQLYRPVDDNDVEDGYALVVVSADATAASGGAKDAGPLWTPSRKPTTSADASAGVDITTSPAAGQVILLDDLIISVNTACLVTLEMETSNNVLMGWYLPANGSMQITARDFIRADAAAKKLRLKTTPASALYAYATWHTEAG